MSAPDGVGRGDVVWTPSPARIASSAVHRLALSVLSGAVAEPDPRQAVEEYDALWRWSVADLEGFWTRMLQWFAVPSTGSADTVLTGEAMPDMTWFPGLEVNYADVCLAGARSDVCLIAVNEMGRQDSWTRGELKERVSRAAGGLREIGVGFGDRVAGYLPNTPEAVVLLLAAASIGAIWSCCPPEFGPEAVIDRFSQIQPTVLVAADGYQYRGKRFDRAAVIERVRDAVPSLATTVWIDNVATGRPSWAVPLARLESGPGVAPEPVPFNHPLWILYSSGTTGAPKAIVHGHGGTILEQLKAHSFQSNIGSGSRFFQNTTIGWTMWNILVSALGLGASIVTYDGAPDFGGPDALWAISDRLEVTDLGVGAAFLSNCMVRGDTPGRDHDLSRLQSIGSTGAALPAEGFRWVYGEVGSDLHLRCNSGGTEVCSGLLGSAPTLPVRAGELQCRPLGVASASWDPAGRELLDQPGELVVTRPMPSMPLRLWGDEGGARYRQAYFDTWPGVWRHGDWVTVFDDGYSIVHGRSDATLNRDGVRIGTAELYRVLDDVPGVDDSLVLDVTGSVPGVSLLLLLVANADDADVEKIAAAVRADLRAKASPRHVPDRIEWVSGLPRTLNGKRLEVPIKRILQGTPVEETVNVESVDRPELLADLAEKLRPRLS